MNKNNLKNQIGGFAPVIIIAILAVLAVGGGAYAVSKNKEKKAQLEDNVGTQANANADMNANENANLGINANVNADTKGSLRSLLALGKNAMCTFTSVNEGDTSSGTVYIGADGDMRGDFKSVTTTSGTINSSMVTKDGISYVWSGTQGMKMEVEASPSANANANQSIDLDAKVDYECSPWTRDESKFNIPTNVSFIDLDAMMKVKAQ